MGKGRMLWYGFLVALWIRPDVVQADKYVNKNCARNGDGSSWSCASQAGGAGAYNDFQASGSCLFNDPSWERGGTYWVAGADSLYRYTSIRNTTGSGGMTIMKATVDNHGTDVGWQDGYGTKPARWAGLNMQIDGIPVTVDGQSGQDTSGYGFILTGTTQTFIGHVNNCSPGRQVYRHLEVTPSDYATTYQTGIAFGVDSSLMQYCYIHHIGQTNIDGPGSYTVMEYCVITDPGMHGGGEHAELTKDNGASHDVTIRYNVFRNWQSTGGIILSEGQSDWMIYGNVFESTHGGYSCGNGVIAGLGSGTSGYTNIKVFNNTFVNITTCSNIFGGGGVGDFSGPGNEVKNNLFYNVPLSDICGGGCTAGKDYNWFYLTPYYTDRRAHDQEGTGDPFVDSRHGDYRLSATAVTAIDRGASLGAPYAEDKDGVSRPQGAGWDMGAYEYVATKIQRSNAECRIGGKLKGMIFTNPVTVLLWQRYRASHPGLTTCDLRGRQLVTGNPSQPGIYLIKKKESGVLQKVVVVE